VRYFTVVLALEPGGVPDRVRHRYEELPRARELEFAWRGFDRAAVLTAWDDPWGDALLSVDGAHVACGTVRLDNRQELEGWIGRGAAGLTDLELVLKSVRRFGTSRIERLVGDFAFVVWDDTSGETIAAVDAVGVKKLYSAEACGCVAFASRAEALAVDLEYEPQYLAELIALCPLSPGLSPYAGVRTFPGGTYGVLRQGRLDLHRYWTTDEFEAAPLSDASMRELPEACRTLLADSVRLRLRRGGGTWAQLSGGLDSSSVVSLAQWLAHRGTTSEGLDGTVTYVDWQDTDADEREYSDAVVRHWRVPNETIVDPPFWFEEGVPPPNLDLPRESLAFYPREQRLCDIVRAAGGRVLLTGFGSDELFTGSAIFFADWLAAGRIRDALREMTRWATLGRISFWRLAYENAIRPLVSQMGWRPASVIHGRLVPWISPTVDRRYELQSRVVVVANSAGRLRHKQHDGMAGEVRAFVARLDPGLIGDKLDVRYPFLYRPLVEFAMRLPAEFCARPQARKWVLREAMCGILPELVRQRVGKGGPTDVLVRSLSAQRSYLEFLTCDPLLAELGVIDADELKASFVAASSGRDAPEGIATLLQSTLMVEAWLRIKSGRWQQEQSRYAVT
jgi:asparagine synthase (glutamine-hydrolysing)